MLAQLATTTQKAEIENVLQQTTARLLHHYKIRAREVELYPIELESYFYRAGVFEDPYVHTNELQANHFGDAVCVTAEAKKPARLTRWTIAFAWAYRSL